MLDWQELLPWKIRNRETVDTTELVLLRDRVLQLLPPVMEAMEAVALLPLRSDSFTQGHGKRFYDILSLLEVRYLTAWAYLEKGEISELAAEFQAWYQLQLRTEQSLFQQYLTWQEILHRQGGEGWKTHLILQLKQNDLLRAQRRHSADLPQEWEILLVAWFETAWPLLECDLFQRVQDFYDFQAVLTGKQPFLSDLSLSPQNPPNHELFELIHQRRFELAAQNFWSSLPSVP